MAHPADLSNWRTSPHNGWAFVNVDEILRTKPVNKSTQPVELQAARQDKINTLTFPVSESTTLSLKQLHEAAHTDEAVVLHHGKIVYDYYAHENTPESKHIVMSMTKSMTGLIIGALIDKGVLREDDKIVQHMPEMKNTAFAPATIRHLIDMRSGINYPDTTEEYRVAVGWEPARPGIEESDLPTLFKDFNPEGTVPPPAGFVYATVNTDVLGLLLERIAGKSYAELLHEHVWQPAGAKYDALVAVDKSGNARAGGGLAASVEDFARVGQALLEGKLASKAWLEGMLKGDTEAFLASPWGPAFQGFSKTLAYRSFWVTSDPGKLCIAMGIHGQALLVDLKNGIVLATTCSQPEPFDPKTSGLTFMLFRTLQHALTV